MEKPYSEDEAWEEASRMKEKINKREASSYEEAAELVNIENELLNELNERLAIIENLNEEEQKKQYPAVIRQCAKIGYVDNYELLTKALNSYEQLIPHLSNPDDPKTEEAYEYEKLSREVSFIMAYNIDKSNNEVDQETENIQKFIQEHLIKRSRIQELIKNKFNPDDLEKNKIPSLDKSATTEVAKTLFIRGVKIETIKDKLIDVQSNAQPILDKEEKQKLFSELLEIKNMEESKREETLNKMAQKYPSFQEIAEKTPKPVEERLKEIKEKYFGKDEMDFEKLLKEKPQLAGEFLKEASELINNPDFQKAMQETLKDPKLIEKIGAIQNFLSSKENQEKAENLEKKYPWLNKAMETAKTGGWATSVGIGTLSILFALLSFLLLDKISGASVGKK
ncbi:MAG TPA: hypothetical protein PK119_00330 [Candidatus Paceibacterota bacterium]|nr:hypothetical protein [Candidatus Paceibacterota bacterium]